MNDTKVVRYTPEVVHKTVSTGVSYGVAEMREREHGTYVTHADYKALEDECERLRARVGELVAADIAYDACLEHADVPAEAVERRRAALEAFA